MSLLTIPSPSIEFGLRSQERVKLCRFVLDSENLLWFDLTGENRDLRDLVLKDRQTSHYSGGCIDTMEYFSPYADVMANQLEQVGPDISLAAFSRDAGCGTRTWYEDITVELYSKA